MTCWLHPSFSISLESSWNWNVECFRHFVVACIRLWWKPFNISAPQHSYKLISYRVLGATQRYIALCSAICIEQSETLMNSKLNLRGYSCQNYCRTSSSVYSLWWLWTRSNHVKRESVAMAELYNLCPNEYSKEPAGLLWEKCL